MEKQLLDLSQENNEGKMKKTLVIKGIQNKFYAQFNKISSVNGEFFKYLENSICFCPRDMTIFKMHFEF